MNQKTKAIIKEYAESLLIALFLALIIRTFVVQAFKIPTGSMNPTLMEGDRILVNKFIYRFNSPQRGDIVVFKYPVDMKLAFIKRLIGLGNERIKIQDGRILINGQIISEPKISSRFYYNQGNFGSEGIETLIPAKNYYVLGDNSANSRDSRFWGLVPNKNVIGKAFFIYWPLHRIRIIE